MNDPIVASIGYQDAPGIAAHLAVLNEAAVDVRLDVDFHLLAAKRTRDQELVGHPAILLHAPQPAIKQCDGDGGDRCVWDVQLLRFAPEHGMI